MKTNNKTDNHYSANTSNLLILAVVVIGFNGNN